MNLKPRWTKGKTEQETKELKASFLDSLLLRERLIEMLEEDIDKSLKSMRNAAREQINLTEFYTQELARQCALEDIIKLIQEK